MTDHPSRAPLRLLLVAEGETIPSWLFRCLESVEESGAATVVLVLRPAREERRGWRHWLYSWYEKIDRHLFRRSPDALAPIRLRSALPGRRVLDLRPDATGLPAANPAPGGRLEDQRIDVVLDPLSSMPAEPLARRSRYGVWRVIFGQSGDARTQSTPAFWEVVEGQPSTETRLCAWWDGRTENRSLYMSVAPTDRRSPSRNQNDVYWRISAALARQIHALWEDPDAFLEKLEAAAPFEVAASPRRAPGNIQMLRASTRLVRRYVRDKWTRARYREQWALAFQSETGDQPEAGTLHTLLPPMDRLWADPFPLQVGNDYYVFHEEARFATGKGYIVVTVVDDKGHPLAPPTPVLERPYHLSYPFVFQWEGDVFMIPESAARRQVELHRCVEFPLRWKPERILLSGPAARDPTLAFLFGRWWLFASIPAYDAGVADELHLFHSDSPLGPWTPHRNNPIKSDVRSARPAGRIFESRGHFHRPAQDGSRRYGYAVSINRILRLDPETYEEAEVDRILPNWDSSVVGVHTFNRAESLTVIDCLVRRRRF